MNYKPVRGFLCSLSPHFLEKNIEEAMDYIPRDGDIAIVSYPKTGTTWMQYIVIQLLSKGEDYPAFSEVQTKTCPYLEFYGTKALEDQAGPRLYKLHLPYDRVGKNGKSKVLYIYRRPEDTLLSYYHFCKSIWKMNGLGLEEFFEAFLKGEVAYGGYLEHLRTFLERRGDQNLLLVSYEALVADPRGQILRVAEFLGGECHRAVLEDDDLLGRIVERTSFASMKKSLVVMDYKRTRRLDFFRKGAVGEGRMVLSEECITRLHSAAREILKDHESVLREWFD